MKDYILSHINDPEELEKLYRSNRSNFKQEFNTIYPEVKGQAAAEFWHIRLNYRQEVKASNSKSDILLVVIASLLAGIIAKFPDIFTIDPEFFYPRNIGFIVFPILSVYFAWKNKLSIGKISLIAGTILLGVIFINLFPEGESDTYLLSCIHLLLFLWSVAGFAFSAKDPGDPYRRLGFLRYNGDLVVISALLGIAGVVLTGITIGLFTLIGVPIEEFYFNYVVIFGLASIPVVGTYLTQTNSQLVGRVSPVIARIFSPLVLIMLVSYLVAIVYAGRDPFNDREFLLIFNLLLIGVMAIIFFSVAESSKEKKYDLQNWVLLLLSVVTVVVNGVALAAILFRITEWGFTPNRLAVLGGNVLMLVNLLLITTRLFSVVTGRRGVRSVGKAIALFLPVYFLWSVIVTFIFPFLFGFK